MSGKRGRPWGSPKGPNREIDNLVVQMRGWLDEAGLKVEQLHEALLPEHFKSREAPSLRKTREMLSGVRLTEEFAEAVADICSPTADVTAARVSNVRVSIAGSRASRTENLDSAGVEVPQLKGSALEESELAAAVVCRQLVRMGMTETETPEEALLLLNKIFLVTEAEKRIRGWEELEILTSAAESWPTESLTALLMILRFKPFWVRKLRDFVARLRPPRELVDTLNDWYEKGQTTSIEHVLHQIGRYAAPGRVVDVIVAFRDHAGGRYSEFLIGEAVEYRRYRSRVALAKALRRRGLRHHAEPLTGLPYYLRDFGNL
ncbi:hypothetical protein OG894_00125 [Streptomyces sp. NBC_01724]|uniref:hypothetical protein n=1 Tax=unclassified Streptomyces TaxID=2593676 RepID=UPI002E2FB159|nr:hypothetical protein [Streptomyces sp. NBC_01724]WTE57325.1 hypothetical protein OG784_00105 [Streptomyces sp. NBC_01617]WTE64803.1 hypothetical protein OG784_42240 [Streptomyces sp. NBC_01617]WTI84839.1 hypothetical protein OHB17_00490 [Streptomyces sp. NBC_00724]WTI92087.1 hypothetical protein OHB17_41515 [Streptomyces sp. NBC_00724]